MESTVNMIPSSEDEKHCYYHISLACKLFQLHINSDGPAVFIGLSLLLTKQFLEVVSRPTWDSNKLNCPVLFCLRDDWKRDGA